MTNALSIAKFGGTSVANYEVMQNCARIVAGNEKTRIVVVSAAAGVTNHLVSLAHTPMTQQQIEETCQAIINIELAILNMLSDKDVVVLKRSQGRGIRAQPPSAPADNQSAALINSLRRHDGADADGLHRWSYAPWCVEIYALSYPYGDEQASWVLRWRPTDASLLFISQGTCRVLQESATHFCRWRRFGEAHVPELLPS